MFNKIKTYGMITALLLSHSVLASDSFNITAKAGGLSGKLAESLSASIKEAGAASIDVNYLGNCKIAENLYNKTQPTDAWVMNLANTSDISTCKFQVELENFVDVMYGQSTAVCYQKDRTDLGIKHFLDPTQRKIWMTMTWFKPVTITWAKDLGITNSAKILAVGHSREVAAASFGREGDYFTLDSTTAIEHKDRLTCLFSTSRNRLPQLGAPTLKEFNSKIRYPIVYASQIIIVSDKKSKTKFQKLVEHGKTQDTWKKFVNQPGIEMFNNVDKWKFFKEQQKLLNDTAVEAKE